MTTLPAAKSTPPPFQTAGPVRKPIPRVAAANPLSSAAVNRSLRAALEANRITLLDMDTRVLVSAGEVQAM